ncbi:MAG TPA: ATP-binding protein [Candidatus Baltobacteraceae bacterium]|nr:ATP-binding protein [Candidatus Baltobacteraceae bacterium]
MDPASYRRYFQRSADSLHRARKIIVDAVRSWLSGEHLSEFEIALGEALANLVEHGGGQTLIVSCACDDERVVVEIEDRVVGFLRSDVVAERRERESPRGYGFLIMHRLLDEVHYLDRGRRLRLVKYLPQSSHQATPADGGV